jgi:tetratricopeptide (TPR) repeat protein
LSSAAAGASAQDFAGVEDSLSGNREATPVPDEAEEEAFTAGSKDEARHHFTMAQERFEAGEFREAVEHFERAYEITHAPEILYNLGRCHEQLDEDARAVENYELYLRMSPDAEDRAEVQARIDTLSEHTDAPAGETKEEEEGRGIRAGVRAQIDMGLSVPLTGEWDRKAIPFDVQFHFPLADWLYVGAGVLFSGFAGDDSKQLNGFPRSEFGLYAGLIGAWNLAKRLALVARVGFAPTWIFRTNQQENAILLDVQGGVGLAIRLVGAWALTAEVIGGWGPVFVPNARTADTWKSDGDLLPSADIGGRVGVLYTF